MYLDFLVKVPTVKGKITRRKKSNVVYIEYEYDRVYDPSRKYTFPKRVTIGKLSDTDPELMKPNQNFLKYFPDAELPESKNRTSRSSCLRVGAYFVLRKIIEECSLKDILGKYFRSRDMGLFLDLAVYLIIAENNAAQYYPDYTYNHPLFTEKMKQYSDSTVSDFLNSVTDDQSTGFLNTWNESRNYREKIYISYDSTNKNCQAAVIQKVLPRKSVFLRKAAGTNSVEQIVAANIDTVFICMSLNNDFNVKRLERYLSVAWNSGAMPVIVLTKVDLCDEVDAKVLEIENIAIGVPIIETSVVDKDGLSQIYQYLKEYHTVAFVGSSGVGKSTLINHILGTDQLETGDLRNDDKGRHTTTHRELFMISGKGMVIDTPGMRELGMWSAEDGIDHTFLDIEELTRKCRFSDCSHENEPGCAVRQAVKDGLISEERYRAYMKLKAENAYNKNAVDYLAAKKRKFKQIAKLNKHNYKQ